MQCNCMNATIPVLTEEISPNHLHWMPPTFPLPHSLFQGHTKLTGWRQLCWVKWHGTCVIYRNVERGPALLGECAWSDVQSPVVTGAKGNNDSIRQGHRHHHTAGNIGREF